jgi:dGTPase
MHEWIGGEIGHDDLIAAFDRLERLDGWPVAWSASRRDLAALKNLTSQLIGRFVHGAMSATLAAHPDASLVRFGANIVIPLDVQAEIAVLKGIVATFVMSRNTRQPIYTQQRRILADLADVLLASNGAELDPGFSTDWAAAADDAARHRVVVDQVASLTDQSALAWYERLVQR